MATKTSLSAILGEDEERDSSPTKSTQARSRKASEPIKLTIELDPELHKRLKTFALLKADDAALADVIRAAIVMLDEHTTYAKAVAREASKLKDEKRERRRNR